MAQMNHEIELQFAQLRGQINEAMDKIEKNETVSTNELTHQAQLICENIAALPASEARLFEPRMVEIIEYLTTISATLTKQRDAIVGDVKALNSHSTAHNAYSKASHYTSPSDKEN